MSSQPESSQAQIHQNYGPRRKPSLDLSRIRNFPSTLYLRKEVAPPSSYGGTFSKLRNLSSARLRRGSSTQNLSTSFGFDQPISPASSSTAKERSSSPAIQITEPDSPNGGKLFKRRSRLLDAFKSSKKPPSTFEVIRSPQSSRNNSNSSQQSQPLPLVGKSTDDGQRIDAVATPQVNRRTSSSSLASRIPSSEQRPRSSYSFEPEADRSVGNTRHDYINYRGAHPPSTAKTRRPQSMAFGRRLGSFGDPMFGPTSTTPSPSPSPGIDTNGGTFNLHSFRNVRSGSDASKAEQGSHSCRQSILSTDEFVTPTDEVGLPSPFFEDAALPETKFVSPTSAPVAKVKMSPGRGAPSAGPFFQSQSSSSSISVARFRQAARTRSETGGTNAAEEFGVSGTRSPGELPADRATSPTNRLTFPLGSSGALSPSQELAALEAEIMHGGRSTSLLKLAKEQSAALQEQIALEHKEALALAINVEGVDSLAPAANTQKEVEMPPTERKRGLFIVVEGLDRAGKSTQVARLAESFGAKEIKFPDRTTAIGQMINSYLANTSDLDNKAIHLLFSANRWECVQSILTTLASGQSIVCDRYAFSGIAYSCAKGLSYEWCRSPDIGLPLPDATIFLDLDAETAALRGGYGEERYEKQEFQSKVQEAFKLVSADVKSHGGSWTTIDAGGSLDHVTRDIQKVVLEVTSRVNIKDGALGKLFVSSGPTQPNRLTLNVSPGLPPPPAKEGSDDRPPVSPSFFSHFRSSSQTGSIPQQAPAKPHTLRQHTTSLSYADHLAAMRSAAAGTISELFGAQAEEEKLVQQTQPTEQDPSLPPTPRGQGLDSGRAIASFSGSRPGRKMTLVEMIDHMETQRSPAAVAEDLPQPPQPWVSDEGGSGSRSASVGQEVMPTNEKFPSTFARANRSRRSLNASDSLAAPPVARSESSDDDDDEPVLVRNKLLPPTNAEASSNASAGVPLISPSPQRAASMTRTASSALESAVTAPSSPLHVESPPNLNPPTDSTRSRKSPAPSASSPDPVPSHRPRVVSTPYAHTSPQLYPPRVAPSSYQLAMLNAQQRLDFQEQYMRNYMAMMSNPMMAQQAQYNMMMMMQRQQQQQLYAARAASEVGGPVKAAFMQPGSDVGTRHSRTTSGNVSSSASPGPSHQPPMLSMMMAPPPNGHVMQPYMQYGKQQRPAAQSELGTGAYSAPRFSHRASMGPPRSRNP